MVAEAKEAMPDRADRTRERILEVAEVLVFAKGFSGTSLSDIVKAANLTKGALFHHFSGKGDLGRALIERYARNDFAILDGFAARAEALADDPLQQILLNIKLFEEWLDGLETPLAGCMYSSFTHQREQFDPETQAFIAEKLDQWSDIYEAVFERVFAMRQPKIDGVTPRDLANLLLSVIQGGLVVGRALDDRHFVVRQLAQLRNYLSLLFAD